MTRRALIRCVLSLLLVVYLIVMVTVSRRARAASTLQGVDIEVNDTLHTGFITAADVNAAAGDLLGSLDTLRRGRLNTLAIEERLRSLQNIESARCVVLNNGVLRIDVTPMIPVARVFPDEGDSYYVNAQGKRMPASPETRIDVPVISGHITASSDIRRLLPMLARIHSDRELDAWASAVTLSPRGDIVIIPAVLGHVVVVGDSSDIDSKFARVRRFYREVLPVKGWNYYDTISVKWRGRVVATRREKKAVEYEPLTETDASLNDIVADEVMLATAPDDPEAERRQQSADPAAAKADN